MRNVTETEGRGWKRGKKYMEQIITEHIPRNVSFDDVISHIHESIQLSINIYRVINNSVYMMGKWAN